MLFEKKAARNFLVKLICFLLIFVVSCQPSKPTYSRKDIKSAIKNLCKHEFNIDVKVWEVGDTIWVYLPFVKVLNKERTNFSAEFSEKSNKVMVSLVRIILSMDKRPQFYCFVASDIDTGFDFYRVWYVEDLKMLAADFISRGEFFERQGILSLEDAKAIGDTQGDHIERHNITLGEFISYLIEQDIERTFTAEKMKEKFKINELNSKFSHGKIEVSFNIVAKSHEQGLPSPFDVAIKSVKKFLKIYNYPSEITEVTVTDSASNKLRFYTIKALREEK